MPVGCKVSGLLKKKWQKLFLFLHLLKPSLFRFLNLSYSSSRRNHELKKQFIYKVLNKAKSAELQDSARGHSTAVLVTHEQKDLSPNPPLLQDTSAEQQVDVFSPSSLIFH